MTTRLCGRWPKKVWRYGYKVMIANSGEAGVEMFREHRDEVALILLDHSMPGMSGEQTWRRLKELRGDVPVVLSSGYDEGNAMAGFKEGELAGFLQKPYTVQRLLERVREILW